MNWLSQVFSVATFGLMSMPQRRGSVAAAMFGIAGVVAVMVGVLSIAKGFQHVMSVSAAPDSAIVLRVGADSEMVSNLSRNDARLVADAPGVARSAAGALASPELMVIINLPKQSTGTDANVGLRGVTPALATQVRENFKIEEGRMFESGKNEVIVGTGAAREFRGTQLGKTFRVGRNDWKVVGVFSAGGGNAESEIWTDTAVLQGAYNRGETLQSIMVRLASPDAFKQFKDSITSNPQLKVKVLQLAQFYADQSKMMTNLITTLGYLIALLMAVGAVFGALNTMYNSISQRTREIATLRALGFGRGAVIIAVMLEALVLALIGGAVGALVAYVVFNGFTTTTMNWQSFSQITFAFAVTPELLVQGIVLAVAIGFFGGLLPAIRAARLPIANALREL